MSEASFYKYDGLIWFLRDQSTLIRGDGGNSRLLAINQWDDGLPKIGSEYGLPCDSRGNALSHTPPTTGAADALHLTPEQEVLVNTFGPVNPEIPGAKKFDGDKPLMHLLMDGCPDALLAVGDVLTYGFKKYGGEHGWKALPNAVKRYESAMVRHQLALASGEVNDPESGLPHAAHIACNALFLLQFHKEKKCN